MNRQEHVEWCKQRAREYLDQGNIREAYTSMASDLEKHPETEGHAGIALGTMMLVSGQLSSVEEMRKFIEGFN